MISIPHRRRPVIGLLLSHLDGSYQRPLWLGIHQACQDLGIDLVVFASRFWRGQIQDRSRQESVYQLASSSRLDGLCVDSSAFVDEASLKDFLGANPQLQGIPLVMSSMVGSGHRGSSFLPDNRDGIAQAVQHLAKVHRCRDIAYVGGPAEIYVAWERLDAFKKSMADLGLPVRPEWILGGSFDLPSGRKATLGLLSDSQHLPEAIVYANDEMAMGGLEVAKELGIAVPGQLRIIGFDDGELSAFTSPSLTTVHQPVDQIGRAMVRCLKDMLEGQPTDANHILPVSLNIRNSCGCHRPNTLDPDKAASRFFQSAHSRTALAVITETLGPILDLEQMSTRLAWLHPQAYSGSSFVCLYDQPDPGQWHPTSHAHVVSAVGQGGEIQVSAAHPKRFLSTQLVPDYLLPEQVPLTLVVQGLSSHDENFGFLAISYREEDPGIIVAIRDQLSIALMNVELVQKEQEQRHRLSEALIKVEESERRYRELAYFLPTLVMETDPQFGICFLNNLGKEIFGLGQNTREMNLRDYLVPGQNLELIAKGAAQGYQLLYLKLPRGDKITLLVQVSQDNRRPGVLRWHGINFKPILGSMTTTDVGMFDDFGLSNREREILHLELAGLLGKEIADHLGLSLSTVKAHIGSMYRKLGISSRDQLFNKVRQKMEDTYGFDSLVFSLMAKLLQD